MARTTKSRGKTNFKLDNSPYPLFKGLKNVAKKIGGGALGALGIGRDGGGEGGSLGERLDRIEQKLDQGNTGSGEATNTLGTVDPAESAAGVAEQAADIAAGGGLGVTKQAAEEEMLEKEV
tara:strand:+ start:839 stop:1201 length:363 start_codon:yes stop_codon:yes gene_type:complete